MDGLKNTPMMMDTYDDVKKLMNTKKQPTQIETMVSNYTKTHTGERDIDWLADFARAIVVQLTPVPDTWPIPTSEIVTVAHEEAEKAAAEHGLIEWNMDLFSETNKPNPMSKGLAAIIANGGIDLDKPYGIFDNLFAPCPKCPECP